ncbi:hypothetical protein DH2020_011697 [Rehmannia glutinosa]|uniref:tRNA (guanine(37)-N1)-methyltransferase n=1 Tax=Rehmannia glutinosa TaxID=99300 RepID=A0ABR0XE87_REHGL
MSNPFEAAFTRVFDIFALESLPNVPPRKSPRGHLLNRPRVKNIARVPGDEIDDQLKTILPSSIMEWGSSENQEELVALNRRIYGKAEGDPLNEVLYRDKLARTFNSRGYARFRNLAKISRPKMKKKRDGGEKRGVKGVGRNEVALVEVIEDEDESDGEDFSRLLGEEFGRRPKWRGSTRLLLLDEQYANKKIEELPEAIKVVFQEHGDECWRSAFELVKCKLTLFYDYWQLNEVLEALLPKGMITPSAFETVGHIAHLNLRDEHLQYKKLIAKVVLDKNRPKIQTVVNKVDAIHNDFRTMQLEVLAGNNSLVTTVVENGLRFHVDLAAVYWNSRLATERQRLLSCFTHRDVVCDVFSGVGPIAISAAKKVKYVYANDLNPCAVEYLERNCVLNKLERKIEMLLGEFFKGMARVKNIRCQEFMFMGSQKPKIQNLNFTSVGCHSRESFTRLYGQKAAEEKRRGGWWMGCDLARGRGNWMARIRVLGVCLVVPICAGFGETRRILGVPGGNRGLCIELLGSAQTPNAA